MTPKVSDGTAGSEYATEDITRRTSGTCRRVWGPVMVMTLLLCAHTAAAFKILSLFRGEPPTGNATVEGAVRDSVSGKPVVAAAVWVRDPDRVAWTDMDGRFRIDSLPPDTQTFLVEATGYLGGRVKVAVPDSGKMQLAVVLSRIPSGTMPGSPPSSRPVLICGTIVHDGDGRPVSGAAVSVRGAYRASQDTQADGIYGFVPERNGSCTLHVHHSEYHDTAMAIEVSGEQRMLVRTIALRPLIPIGDTTAIVRGVVIDSLNEIPLAGATVSVLNTDHSITTGDSGDFTLSGVSGGEHTLVTTKAGYVPRLLFDLGMEAGDTVWVRTAMVPRSAAETAMGRLRGTIVGTDSLPMKGVTVSLVALGRTTTTDTAGTFTFDSLASDFYQVEVRDSTAAKPLYRQAFVEPDALTRLRIVLDRHRAPAGMDPANPATDGAMISGVVMDSATGAPLPGAQVRIERPYRVAVTDRNGTYRLDGLSAKSYRLRVIVDGYLERLTGEVHIDRRNGVVERDIRMVPSDVKLLVRHVVRGTALNNTGASLIARRKEALSISDGIASDEMSRYGASDAADALQMVTGVTIIDGKYVNVRGLSGRYSTVSLNGVRLPSSEPDRHAVSLDIFPTGLLDNIEVSKTWTPDMPADFAGGTVDLVTASFPEELSVDAKVSVGYRQGVTGRTMILDEPRSLDWLGFDDGTRDVPDILSGRRVEVPDVDSRMFMACSLSSAGDSVYYFGEYGDEEWEAMHEQLDRMSKAFETGFVPHEVVARPDLGVGFSAGNTFTLFDRPFGLFGAVTYGNKNSYFDDGRKVQRDLKGHDSSATKLDSLTSFVDKKGTNEVSWSALVNAGYELGDSNTVEGLYMYSRIAENTAHSMYSQYHYQATQGESRFFRQELLYRQRGLHVGVLDGSHVLPVLTHPLLKWSAGLSRSFQHEPDHRVTSILRTVTVSTQGGETVRDTTYRIPMAFGSAVNPEHRYRYITEDGREAAVDLTVPCGSLPWHWDGTIRARGGYSYRYKGRDYFHNGFELQPGSGAISLDSVGGDLGTYTADEHLGVIGSDSATGRYVKGLMVRPKSDTAVNHTALLESQAAYAMVELPVVRFFTLIGGMRKEWTVMRVESWRKGDSLYEGGLDTGTFHAGIQGIVKLPSDMQVKGGFSNTAVLPIFREKAPYAAYDMALEYWLKGNPALQASHIRNYDLRWEWFLGPGELVAASVFHKQIRQLIVKGYSEIENNEITFRNIDEPATITGLELEARKRLDFVAPWLEGLAVGGNLVVLRSRWHVDKQKETQLRAMASDPDMYRPLPGASPYVVNASLKYDNQARGLSMGAYFNVFGKRLDFMTADQLPDVYEYPRPWLTATVSKAFGKGLELKLKGSNLFNAEHTTGHMFRGHTYTRDVHAKGRSYSLSCTYSFF